MHDRVKAAVQQTAVPPYLETRIRHTIRSAQRPASMWQSRWVAATATVVVCLGMAIAYQLGHLRLSTSSQESYIGSVSNQVATVMRAGLGDHIHCAVFRKFPKNPPTMEEFHDKMPAEYQALIPAVRSRIPEEYRLVAAHECRHRGRKFIHLALKNDSALMSLVIARKQDGESFDTEGLMPALVQSGLPYYRNAVQRFEISAFESREHLVYFISNLPKEQNNELMLAVSQDVRALLSKLEG